MNAARTRGIINVLRIFAESDRDGAWRHAATAVSVTALLLATVCHADDRAVAERTPFAVVSVASVDRVLDDLESVLGSAGQQDRMTHIRNVLRVLNNLDGIDRARPLGLLLFLSESPPHDAKAVAFLPVTDLDRLSETLRLTQKLSIENRTDMDRFQLKTPEKTLSGLFSKNWIFLTEDESLLNEQLPDLLAASPADLEHYDGVLTLRRDGIPEVVVNRALDKLHHDLERDLQPKEGETNVEHRFRSRLLRGIGGLIERFVTDAENMTVGLELSEGAEEAHLDIRLNVGSDSPLAHVFGGLARPDSQFSTIAQETAPLTLATTWRLGGEPAGIASDLLAHVRSEVTASLERPDAQNGPHPFERILTSLSQTINSGRVDGLVQFIDADDGKFVLVAAAHVADADSMAIALQQIMQHLAAAKPEAIQVVEVNALEVGGVTLHRLRGRNMRRQDRRLYGEDASLYLGAGRGAVWLAVGGDGTHDALERIILAPPSADPPRAEPLPILKASVHLSSWLALAGEGNSDRERKLAAAARLAFRNTDEDGVHLELFADEAGLRLNVVVDRGYIRLLGVALAARLSQ